jgi:sortase (surface protein transpeptidase)
MKTCEHTDWEVIVDDDDDAENSIVTCKHCGAVGRLKVVATETWTLEPDGTYTHTRTTA